MGWLWLPPVVVVLLVVASVLVGRTVVDAANHGDLDRLRAPVVTIAVVLGLALLGVGGLWPLSIRSVWVRGWWTGCGS